MKSHAAVVVGVAEDLYDCTFKSMRRISNFDFTPERESGFRRGTGTSVPSYKC